MLEPEPSVFLKVCQYSCLLPELTGYLARFGKTPCFVLGKHELAIYDNIKDAITSSDQLSLNTEGFTQFIRQTGSVRLIVSLSAIVNIDFHSMPPAITGYFTCCESNLVLIAEVVNISKCRDEPPGMRKVVATLDMKSFQLSSAMYSEFFILHPSLTAEF